MTGTDARRVAPADARAIGLFFGVLASYVAGSELAFRLADAADMQAVLFIPAGITAGALLSTHRSWWPWVLVAAAAAELIQDLRAGLDVGESLGFVAANVAEPLVGAIVVRRAVGRRLDLSYRRHVHWFLGASVGAGPLVGGLLGALSSRALGGGDFDSTFAQWWLGDALGVLLVGTLILVWSGARDPVSVFGAWGAVLIGGSVAATAVVVVASDLPLLFVVLTGVVVAGAQFGVRAVVVTSAAVALTLAVCFVAESGPVLAGMSDATALIVVKLKLLVFTSAGLVVASETFARVRMTEAALRLSDEAAAEHAIVVRLQRLFLPPEYIVGEHYEARGAYLAGTSALGVGGDWYDVAALPDGRVVVTVGDVVGRGAHAAAVMARLRAVTQVLAARSADAGELLTALDEHTAHTIDALGTTVWAGLFDPTTCRLSYASAGHPPGFLLAAGRDALRLGGPVGAPLGVTPDLPKPYTEIELDSRSTLVLYTDGLIERRHEALDAGLGRLEAALCALAPAAPSPERIVDALMPSEHADDTVILAVALRSPPPPASLPP